MKRIIFLCLFPLLVHAKEKADVNPNPPPKLTSEMRKELKGDQKDLDRAKKLFDPWYTGPLISPSATMMPPAVVNYQPYIFVQTNYQHFDKEHTAQPMANEIQLITWQIFQTGITDWMDAVLVLQGVENWQSHKNGGSFGDSSFALGWQISEQGLWAPQIKLAVKETFPSGRFNHLNSNGLALDGVGMGSYQTTISLTFSKVLLWNFAQPLNTRFYAGYTIPTTVHVGGFNYYGGGFGTRGKVRPGNNFSADLGIEWSFARPWVAVLDIVYLYTARTTFTGNPGLSADGAPAVVGFGSSDNLSLAPAFEYNWNENLALIAGAQFSVYGRNSNNFASGMFSLTWTFQPR